MTTRKRTAPLPTSALVMLLAAGLTADPLWAQPKVDAPTVRVVLRGFAKMPQYTNYLTELIQLCVAAKRLPGGSVAVPTAQVLAALPISEEETLFDGYWAATFKTQTVVMPDLNGQCKVMLMRTYSAHINKSCSYMTAASTDDQTTAIAAGQSPTISVVHEKRTGDDSLPARYRCNVMQKTPIVPVNGLPVVKTLQGTACIWGIHLSNRDLELMGRAELVDKRPQTGDVCVHPKWQLYPTTDWSGQNRIVKLKVFKSLRTMGDTDLADAMPTVYAANQDTYIFEEGQPISPARFTETAVRAHVSQPAWVPIGKP